MSELVAIAYPDEPAVMRATLSRERHGGRAALRSLPDIG
jgi:hypothetical protein